MRRTRSDCTVGTFEKNMDYHQELFVIKMEETPEVIKKLEQSEKKVANMYQLKSNQRRCHIISGCFFYFTSNIPKPSEFLEPRPV